MAPTPLTRRRFLQLAGGTGLVLAAGPSFWRQPAIAGAAPPDQLHLQFGTDAAREIAVSWATPEAVRRPRVRFGTVAGGLGTTVEAATRTYTDFKSGREVITHHASLRHLRPSTDYVYEVLHDGVDPVAGAFTTGPSGRAPFRFASFGDQGTGDPNYLLSTPFGSYVVDQLEGTEPLFTLMNGDLAYSNLQTDAAGSWDAWFNNNMRSARYRPWMPSAGNHENETGNGPQGYLSYLTRFELPDNHNRDFRGNWYTFVVGSVQVVSLQNDDVCYQDGGNFYIHGYSAGAQRRWLEQTLAAARRDVGIDWVVVCMHQVMTSSANANGCDLGIRQEFGPLFDRYGVDLVLCGHEHDYERTYPVRGVEPDSATLRPRVVSSDTATVDTSTGTVHMVLGGGGSIPTNAYGGTPAAPTAKVITGRTTSDSEPATWSAVRDPEYAYGFATFDVDPGRRGGLTTMDVTYYRTAPSAAAAPIPFERFTLQRPRRDH